MSIEDVIRSWDQEEGIMERQIVAMKNEQSGFDCHKCKHIHEDTISCDAFPDVIPSEINNNVFDHRKPFPGDGGIMFEPKNEDQG